MNFLPVMRNTNTNKVKLTKGLTSTWMQIFREITRLLQHSVKIAEFFYYSFYVKSISEILEEQKLPF